MQLEELHEEEMYVLCAPDGSPQIATMAPDFPMCVAMCEVLGSAGVTQPLASMFEQGFMILPVKVTIIQNGDENKAFSSIK